MKVGDILRHRTDTRIATVRMHETVGTAARLLETEKGGALVVDDVCWTEGNVAIGIFTATDVARARAQHGDAGLSLKVSALISIQQLASCSPADDIHEARALMHARNVRHLPVIDGDTLIGVISLDDIARAERDPGFDVPPPGPAAERPRPHARH